MSADQPFQTLDRVARRVGVPVKWLIAEAEAGRVPTIMAGRTRLANAESVSLALARTAERAVQSLEDIERR